MGQESSTEASQGDKDTQMAKREEKTAKREKNGSNRRDDPVLQRSVSKPKPYQRKEEKLRDTGMQQQQHLVGATQAEFAQAKAKLAPHAPHLARISSDDLINVEMYQEIARRKLPKMMYDYYRSGSDDMITLQESVDAFKRIKLRPRVFVDVSPEKLHYGTTILGAKVDLPILVAPSAMHKMACDDGEKATARASASMNTLFTLSSLSTSTLEDVAQAAPDALRWFQLYITKDRELTKNLVKRAEKAGFRALVVTVDAPRLGNREPDKANKFHLPKGLNLALLNSELGQVDPKKNISNESALNDYFTHNLDASLSWKDIAFLKSITTLPIVLKGIVTEEDAILAVKHGASGIWVSTHGGRQLDTTITSIEALPEVVAAVKSLDPEVEVYMDGGVRRGTDVLKALALGARAVFVGRPILWGLSVDGENGARHVLQILKREFELAMVLSGCPTLGDIKPSLLWNIPKRPFDIAKTEGELLSKL